MRKTKDTLVMQMQQSTQWLGLYDTDGNKLKTKVFGYNRKGDRAQFLGPTIIAKQGKATNIKWVNKLGSEHILDIPPMAHNPKTSTGIPTVVHLHGGDTEWESDGHPDAWYTPGYQQTGHLFRKKVHYYENNQEAATLWYHDHTMGITRLNVNAGLAGMYWLRDENEKSLNLPKGQYERGLLLQDYTFDDKGQISRDGENMGFFGDFMLINGMAWPKMTVEPRKYRFRVVNGSDSRAYRLSLSNLGSFIQIGSDGGMLNAPQSLNSLEVAPGERFDIIIDFSTMAGQKITLNNTMGIVHGTHALDLSMHQLMRFDVGYRVTKDDNPLPYALRSTPYHQFGEVKRTRKVLVGQALDHSPNAMASHPIIDLLGTVEDGLLRWGDDATEIVHRGDTEIWEIHNTLLVPHPIHLHPDQFEILDRQAFTAFDIDMVYYGGATGGITPIPLGPIIAPSAQEAGRKDIVIAPPMTITRIKVKFSRTGNYAWHCHMLTHSDHDMMRPLVIQDHSGHGGQIDAHQHGHH